MGQRQNDGLTRIQEFLLTHLVMQIVKENQKLHVGKDELLDDSMTLADLNILPGANLWVMDTGQHENRDITGTRFSSSNIRTHSSLTIIRPVYLCFSGNAAEELPTERTGRVETEEGFRGTRLLMGGLPSLVESLSAHAVQSGVVPQPLLASRDGSPGTPINVLNQPPDEAMVTEQLQQRVVAEGSEEEPDRSMVDDVSSGEIVQESDHMDVTEQDAAGKNVS